MEINYKILLVLSILPLLNKYLFWLFTIQLKEYRLDRFKEYLSTTQWKNAILNIWAYIEIPVIIFSIGYYINPIIENSIFNVLFYLLLFETIFVFSKIFKKKIFFPKITFRLVLTLSIVILLNIFIFFIINNLYLFITLNLFLPFLLIFLSIFISLPIVNNRKNKKIFAAKLKSKIIKDPIKIGITWSYWKSSVKEYLSQILESNDDVLSTPKNVNTELWVSDVILKKLKNKYKFFVVEMGAYKIGEIETLWEIVDHKYWFLTAIWNQHLALFWWIKNIIKWKSEIAKKVLENKWVLYVNWDDKNIRKVKFNKKLNLIKYWIKESCDAKSEIINIKKSITKFNFYYKWTKSTYKTNLLWTHNIINITWILAFCYDIWIDKEIIWKKLLNLKSPENTLFIIEKDNKTFIDDTYNLSEWWLFAWLEVLNYFDNINKKILILDDILELWNKSSEVHFNIWKKIGQKKMVDKIMYVWINYKQDFIKWLVSGGFKLSNLIDDLKLSEKNDILIFEWRKAKLSLNQILWKKH